MILHYSGFGRKVYVIGNSKDVARLLRRQRAPGQDDRCSSRPAWWPALAGLLYAARLGAMRGSTADGFELDIITMVLLGGVSIFGGTGSLWGVLLSILIILNLRNGMGLANISGEIQKGFVGVLLILSVLVPNLFGRAQESMGRRRRVNRPAETAEA